ncbi:MAG TPA: hypothetical protein VK961_23405 [Chthoniobacter sp.]|nr:hypothetical protein [Chthoniobacter sp.]
MRNKSVAETPVPKLNVNPTQDMSRFGKTVFSGSPFLFWTLGPCCLLCAIFFGFFTYATTRDHDVAKAVVGGVLTIISLCGVLVLFNPTRFSWAGRVVTGSIFAAYVFYAFHEIFVLRHPWSWGGSRGATTPVNSLLGLFFIGGPCLWYTLFKRFSLKKEPVPAPRPRQAGLQAVKTIGPAPRIQRPLHTSEAAVLQEMSVFPPVEKTSRRLAWVTLWATACLAGIVGFFWSASHVETGPGWMPMAMAFCFLFPIFTFYAAYANLRVFFHLRRVTRIWREKVLPERQEAIESGMASVVRVEAAKLIVIEEEWGDMAMLFELADGNTLFLRGEDYVPPGEDAIWPAARFEIVRSAVNDMWILFWSENAPLEPALTVPFTAMPDEFTRNENCPFSESILAGSAEENLHRLGYQPEKDGEW